MHTLQPLVHIYLIKYIYITGIIYNETKLIAVFLRKKLLIIQASHGFYLFIKISMSNPVWYDDLVYLFLVAILFFILSYKGDSLT